MHNNEKEISKIRGIVVDELKAIQGFPKDYVLIGTQTEQKKYIGNAVHPKMARVLFENSAQNKFGNLL